MLSKHNEKRIMKDFPIFRRRINNKRIVYLDNAATTQKPQFVIEKIREYYERYNANIHRGIHRLSEEATKAYEDAHIKVGRFINSKYPEEEVVFVRNTTEAINLVAYALTNKLGPGDEVLTTIMEHHSNLIPWLMMEKKGIKVSIVDITEEGVLDLKDFMRKLNANTKLVAITHASNVLGTINDIKKITELAHEKGALVLVDGAQSVPHFKVDVQELDCDFLAFSGHKMLAPTGIGVLYGKKHVLEDLEPFLYGGDMIKDVKLDNITWNDLPWKFEAGTPNIAGGIALGYAVDYLIKIGMDNIRKHEVELTKYALKKLSEISGVKIYGPQNAEERTGVVAFNIEGIHGHDVATILDSLNIAIRTGHHCAQPLIERLGENSTCRASFYIYNTKEDIDLLVEGIHKVKKIFRKK